MDDWVSFCLAALVLLITPGPTNTLLAASGAIAGVRRSLPLIPAEICGYLISIAVLCLALGPLIQGAPQFETVLRLGCGAYVLYLAFRLWLGGAGVSHDRAPIAAGKVFTTTLLNPKGIIFAFVIVPHLRDGRINDALPYLAALSAMICAVALCWIGAGASLRARLNLAPDDALVRRTSAVVLGVFAVVVTTSAFRV